MQDCAWVLNPGGITRTAFHASGIRSRGSGGRELGHSKCNGSCCIQNGYGLRCAYLVKLVWHSHLECGYQQARGLALRQDWEELSKLGSSRVCKRVLSAPSRNLSSFKVPQAICASGSGVNESRIVGFCLYVEPMMGSKVPLDNSPSIWTSPFEAVRTAHSPDVKQRSSQCSTAPFLRVCLGTTTIPLNSSQRPPSRPADTAVQHASSTRSSPLFRCGTRRIGSSPSTQCYIFSRLSRTLTTPSSRDPFALKFDSDYTRALGLCASDTPWPSCRSP